MKVKKKNLTLFYHDSDISDNKKPWLKKVLFLTTFQNNLTIFGFQQSK